MRKVEWRKLKEEKEQEKEEVKVKVKVQKNFLPVANLQVSMKMQLLTRKFFSVIHKNDILLGNGSSCQINIYINYYQSYNLSNFYLFLIYQKKKNFNKQ